MLTDALDGLLRGEEIAWHAVGADAAGLLDACAAQDLSALVHHRVTRLARAADWPEDVRRELARAAHAAAIRETVIGKEISAVLGALAREGVHPVLLKGVPLAYTVYADPSLRSHLDTDFIVRRDQTETVRRTLDHRGYAGALQSDGELVLCQFALSKTDALGIVHAFDVHWKISTQPVFADLLTYDELAAGAEPVPALGPDARAAGRFHALLLACIHPVMHHRNVDRLVWICDIHLLASGLPAGGWDRFIALAAAKGVAAIAARQLAVARARLGTPVPDQVLEGLARAADQGAAEPSAAYLRPGRRWHDELLSSLRGLDRWSDRLRLLREVLFPGPRYMLESYGLGRAGFALLPALYVHRVAAGVWKVLRRRK